MEQRVLIVGNDSYPGNELEGCRNDADAYGRWSAIANATETRILHDANKKQMVDGMKWLAETGGLFFYSGHGTLHRNPEDASGFSEAICPIDTRRGNVITDCDMADIFVPGGQRIICILDCCHGNNESYARDGDDFVSPPPVAGRYMETDVITKRDNTAYISKSPETMRKLWLHTRVAILGACKSYESAYEVNVNGHHRGAFSFALLGVYNMQGLRAWTNQAGSFIRKRFNLPSQVPRAVGAADILGGSLWDGI